MANCTVTLLLGHLDIRINNLVKKSWKLSRFLLLESWENTEPKSSETFSCSFLYKLFQGVLQAKNTLLSFCMGEKKAFCLSSLLLKHRNFKISNLDVFLHWKLTNLSYV